jgi:hypothetical protein
MISPGHNIPLEFTALGMAIGALIGRVLAILVGPDPDDRGMQRINPNHSPFTLSFVNACKAARVAAPRNPFCD